MVNYDEKKEGCLLISSLLETLGFNNGKWEFNYGRDIPSLKTGLIYNYNYVYQYQLIGGISNYDFKQLNSSDDTILMIATTEAVINGGGIKNYMDSYLKYYNELKEDKRYAGVATLTSLEKIRQTKSIESIQYSSSMGGNGCAIRTAPIGLKYYKDIDKVCDEALQASIITHNYSMGFLGGIIAALFTAYAVQNISPFKWSLKLEELYNKKFFHTLIKKYFKEKDLDNEIDSFFMHWLKYNEDRLSKMKYRSLPKFADPLIRLKELSQYSNVDYTNTKIHSMGFSALECLILAYDNLLLSALPDKKFIIDIENPKFSFETLIFLDAFFFGDNDSISAVCGAWFGALNGIDKFPIEKVKQLEFYEKIINLSKNL